MPETIIKYSVRTSLVLQGLKIVLAALVLAASIPLSAKSKEEGYLLLPAFSWTCVSGDYVSKCPSSLPQKLVMTESPICAYTHNGHCFQDKNMRLTLVLK